MKQRNPVTKERRKSGRKVLAAVLSLAMILTLANPTTVFAAEKDGTEQSGGFWHNAVESIADFFGFGDDEADAGVQTRAATTNATLTADGDTKDAYSIGDETSTRYNGRVWVDKSVSADSSVSFGDNLEVDNNSDFLITYSALATSTNIIGQTPTDTVFILDLSASMTWGYRDSGQSVPQDESRLQAMVDSMNSAIDTLVKANPQNRIAIVTFNGSCQADQALIPDLMTGEEILAEVTDGKYLEIQNYNQNLGNDPETNKDRATADVYCYATDRTASTSGGTNIQAGLFRGMSILANTTETTATVNGTTVTRVPNVILMSDGAPTTFSSSENASYVYHRYDGEQEYENGTRVTGIITNESGVLREGDNEVYSGDWWETNSGEAIGAGNNNDPDSADGFMALLTASYFKNAISNNYYPDSNKEANVYTIGFGTEVQDADMVAMANLVLDPGEKLGVNTNYDQVDKVSTAWETYQEGKTPTVHAPIGDGKSSLDIPFVVSQCDESENNPTSLDYPTRYYAAADDKDLNQIFTEIASLITSQASAPTEVTGDPLDDGYITYTDTTGKYMEIKDVTTLIFMDQKLEVMKDNSQSNDTVTTYVADGYEYENPAYPGGSYNTNQIKITVTDNADSTQTIKVEIPAALIPLRVNTITLNGNSEPTNSTSTGNLPLRLCYEVGLEDGINATTLEGVDESYINANTENGKVNFYSNAYDKDSTEVDKGVGATVTFEAAPTNPFYFVQEDTPLYLPTGQTDGSGNPTYERATEKFDESTIYYFPVTYYTGSGEKVEEATTYVARSGATLTDYVDSDAEGLYIEAGSPRIGNLADVTAAKDKDGGNATGTYGNYREPTFVYDDDNHQNPQEGRFLVLLGNNGKLQVNVPATLTIAKEVTAEQGLTAPDKNFTFVLTVPSKAGETVTAVLHTTNAADQSVTLVFDNDGKAQIQNDDGSQSDITLEGGQSLEIPGMGSAQYTVVEQNAKNNDGFDLTGINSAGAINTTNEVVSAKAEGTVSTEDATVTFTNNYTATFDNSTTINLSGTKNLDVGDGLTYELEDNDFTFTVTPLNGAPGALDSSIGNANSTQVTDSNDWTSTIALLSNLTFSASDMDGSTSKTFSYIITENLPDGVDADNPTADGIIYDTAAYKVDITVTDDGKGTLSADDPEITKGVWDDSGFTADGDQSGVSKVVFTNSYEPSEITLGGDSALTVNKKVLGADTDEDFSFTATFNAEESAAQNPAGSALGIKGYSDTFELTGNVSDSFTAGETKSVSLSEVTFTRPGTYVFDVNEDQTEAPEGWSYDNTTRQIVVKIVERNGALAVDGEIAAPTFTNIYFNYGDAKDVFATDVDGNKTGSSIDGQLVGISDTLTYEITWTNTKSEAANVVVTDTIPTGTQIAVNADSNNIISDGGVLDNGVITWNLGQKEAGESGTVSFAVVVTEDALDITAPENTVTNQATITIGEGASQVELITNRTENPVPEKSVTDNDTSTDGTQVGDTLTYTIQYANAGDEPVDMVITDKLSEGLTYVPNSAGKNAQYDEKTRTITWTLTDVPANTMDGQVSFQAVVNENAAGQTIENEAKITVGNNPQITTNKTETEVKTGSLMISKMITVNEGQGTVIDTTKAFTFTVVLTDKKGNTLDGEYSYNGTSDGTTEYQGTITSGGTITLKHNGSVTITGLPEGAKYTVTETPEAGYTAQNAELTGNIPTDSATTAAFVNNYSAGQATLTGATNLEVTKVFNGKDWGDEVFTFTLTQTGGDTTKVTLPANASNLQIGSNTADHQAAFGDIIFTAAGEYTFEISEVIPENPGQIQYDNHKVTITVNVTDNKSGSLEAVASATTSGSMTFENTYTPQEITANIQALKTISGRDLRDTDDFTFTITPQDGAPATTRPEAHNGGQDNAVIDFGTATFTEAGTYTYLITETGGSVAGVTNSTQTITATVQVDYDEATGTLSSEVSYSGGDGDAGNMFTNVYQADPVVPAEFATGITGTKTVTASEGNSYTMQGEEFSFTLTPSASNPSTDPVEATTITNEADGSLVFVSGPVTYTESGTYTYTIKENDSSESGITEDGSLYTIVVTVTDNGDGKLTADVSITKDGTETDAITFDNDYDPTKTGVTINGTKELTGKNIENNMFTFQITGEDGAPMPSATKVQNTGSSFAFGTIEYTEPGTYVYHISEVNDGKTGYTYDDTEYDVTVVVKDKDGALHAEVSGADAIVFKNSYMPNPVTLTGETALRAHKTLTGRGLNAEEFVFEVKDADGNVLTTGTNDADSNVVFGDLTFDQTGTYNYTISERNDSLGGITYDGTIYTVQIDVTDAGGYLEAAVQYFEGTTQTELPEFENKYTAAPTGVSLGASKILTGRDLKDGEFAFVLKDADGNTVDEAVNDANGSVKFDEITYDQAGTYRYTVAEVKGDDTAVTYDETVYDVTVEVTDNGIGALEPTVTIGNGEDQGIVFTNEYNEPENPTPGNEDTPDDKTPDKKSDNGGTTQSSDRGNVQTGDTAQFIPVVAALLASLLAVIAIAVIMIRRRRR